VIKLSLIIPTLNEAENIAATLAPLQPLRQQGHELIVSDGGSSDATVALAQPLVDHLINSEPGRALQMNSGAALANGDVLLFLHADTQLPDNAAQLIEHALHKKTWGRFDVRLSGTQPLLRLIEFMMNWRSRLTGICTGDQALFISHGIFHALGGFPEIPLMEDIAISAALKQQSRPACIATPVITSSRRWEQHGILRTLFLMWRLRLAYFCGADPERLAARYREG
jgi:rSAM/selenodomain-associated transferase 2